MTLAELLSEAVKLARTRPQHVKFRDAYHRLEAALAWLDWQRDKNDA